MNYNSSREIENNNKNLDYIVSNINIETSDKVDNERSNDESYGHNNNVCGKIENKVCRGESGR